MRAVVNAGTALSKLKFNKKISTMTEEEILRVQRSWRLINNHSEEIGASFYERLFERRPDFKNLFSTDKSTQGNKLMNAIALAVTKLYTQDPDDAIKAVGKRHVAYRVKPEYYSVFGEVLLETFSKHLGEDWTPELADAWGKAYQNLSRMMIKAEGYEPPKT